MIIAVNTRFLLKNRLEGIGWVAYETLSRMVAAHPEDTFIFFFDRPYDPSFVFAENVKPVVLFPQARHPFLFIWWFEWSVARALKRYKVDVFLSPDNFCTLRTTVPTCLVVHDVAWTHPESNVGGLVQKYYDFFAPRFLQKATRIVTVSNFVKQDALRAYPFLDSHKIDVAHNGCRSDFKPLANTEKQGEKAKYTEGSDFFIFVGAVHPRKNVHRLIEAFSVFKQRTKSTIKLVIVGRFGWQTGDVKSAFEASAFQKDIIFTGYVANEEMPKLVGSTLAVTYISLSEGFGIPILEGFNCDVPVVTSTTTSMPEVAADAALLVNPESIEAIAEAMKQVAFDAVLRADLIEKGRIRRKDFDWDTAATILYENIKLTVTRP
ncbi:MAG: glycosyltransferase family 1 protein [Saprospiraceae bacterium]|nr:glycosyltransferase family 1 protein [Saprospiraceae bacterium]